MSIKLSESNPFATGFIVEFPEGDSILQRKELIYEPSASKDITHVTTEGDTIYGLAYKYYGDDKWWHVIADANQLYNPFDLQLGLELLIPDLDVAKALRV